MPRRGWGGFGGVSCHGRRVEGGWWTSGRVSGSDRRYIAQKSSGSQAWSPLTTVATLRPSASLPADVAASSLPPPPLFYPFPLGGCSEQRAFFFVVCSDAVKDQKPTPKTPKKGANDTVRSRADGRRVVGLEIREGARVVTASSFMGWKCEHTKTDPVARGWWSHPFASSPLFIALLQKPNRT